MGNSNTGPIIGCSSAATVVLGSLAVLFTAAGFAPPFELSTLVVALALAAPLYYGAWWFATSARRARQALHTETASVLERQVLAVAAAHGGEVTPALLIMQVPGLTLDDAATHLDEMAAAGHCVLTTDDDGRSLYLFATGTHDQGDRELSPEEWVRQASGGRERMRADEGTEATVQSVQDR